MTTPKGSGPRAVPGVRPSGRPQARPLRLEAAPGRALVRAAGVALAALAAAFSLAGTPALYQGYRTLSYPAYDDPAAVRANLADLGLSPDLYAAYLLAIGLLFTATCFGVAAVIFWRRSDEPMALFAALVFVLLGATFSGSGNALGELGAVWGWTNRVLNAASLASVLLFFYVFPDGRFVPRPTRWLAIALVAYVALTEVLPDSPTYSGDWSPLAYASVLGGWLLAGVVAQVYRYRYYANALERLQTRWVVFGFAVALLGFAGVILLQGLFPSLEPGTLAEILATTASLGFMLLIPLSFAFAVTRYRLYDIDLLINRTLIYGSLTATLILLYLGSVTATQTAFRLLTGQPQQPQLAVVASTLVIAALFTPLRRRIQRSVDRRFYRRKYDARRTLEAFTARLRDEMDLQRLGDELVGVVDETMRPAHLSLWLGGGREPLRPGRNRDPERTQSASS